MQKLEVAGLAVTVASIYGNCDDAGETRDIMRKAMDAMQEDNGVQVIGADWNASVEEVKSWVEEDGPGWEVVYPAEDTCFTGAGGAVS